LTALLELALMMRGRFFEQAVTSRNAKTVQ
jgi:hypothetical protein